MLNALLNKIKTNIYYYIRFLFLLLTTDLFSGRVVVMVEVATTVGTAVTQVRVAATMATNPEKAVQCQVSVVWPILEIPVL